MAENDPVDKALRCFVYAPLGFAAYLRDSAPTLMTVLVNRGKQEADGARRVVEERLGLRTPPAPPAQPIAQRVADGLGRFATQAGTVVAGVARPVVGAATSAATSATTSTAPSAAPTAPSAPPNGSGTHWSATEAPSEPVGEPASEADLPIADYDGLSATQIIERLDGLSRGALERIRVYEIAHRARRTILAAIDQLTS